MSSLSRNNSANDLQSYLTTNQGLTTIDTVILLLNSIIAKPTFSFLIMWVVIIMLPFLAETEGWEWFAWAKRYTILGTALAITWLYRRAILFPELRNQTLRISTTCLFLITIANVLEIVIIDLLTGNIINSILLGFITLFVPLKWVYNREEAAIAFHDPAWCIASSICFGYTYFFNLAFNNSALAAQLILLIAFIGIFLMRDWLYWGPYHIFYITTFVIIDSIFPNAFTLVLFPSFWHPENHLLFQNTWLEYMWLLTGIIAVVILLIIRLRNVLSRDSTPINICTNNS
ncbi:MAG: hypothetical protein OCC49_17105 [Fibrobacterales bacterium]